MFVVDLTDSIWKVLRLVFSGLCRRRLSAGRPLHLSSNQVLYTTRINSPILLLVLSWCPYMAIDVSVQYNGGLLPDIILLTPCNYIGELF